jgi:hypothetical protein
LAPLLQNRFPEEDNKENKSKARKIVHDAMEDATKALYKNIKGRIVQPSAHIKAAMVKAGARFILEGRTSFKDAIKGGVFISPPSIPHKYPKWVLDRQPVVIQRARIMRARPRFDKWELTFTLEIIDDRISIANIKEILTYAGLYCGIGDSRPEYGRFEITKFKELK